MLKKIYLKKSILCLTALVTLASGCMGHNGLSTRLLKWNLTVVEHRWAREGVFLALWITLIYPICGILDLLIFNSIEFWTGKNNLLGGKPAIVDMPMSQVEKMGFHQVKSAQVERLSSTEAKLYLDFKNGDIMTLDVIREDMDYYVYYKGVEFYKGTIN
ncbi:MAG: DUF3332 domain-containing protein [Lentisphaeria bacterium]|nr:DUF3332 domain-containing protein [Lentisphaeria bacterium]